MGRSNESFSKKEKEKKKKKKKEEKLKRKQERKDSAGGGDLDDMIAYVDEYGNILDAPPDPEEKEEIDPESIQLGAAPVEEADEADLSGKVEFYNDEKGFGFIKQNSGDKLFFHISRCIDEVYENDKVTFEVEMGDKGPVAVDVKKV